MFCPSPTCALCQESSEGWTPSRCPRRSQVKAAGIPGRAPLPSMMSQRSGHAYGAQAFPSAGSHSAEQMRGIRSVLRPMSCRRSYSSPSRRALQSPRRPACRPSGLWPVASACAAGSYPEDRTGHSLPALRACTLPAGRVRQGQPQPEPRGHAMRVCCLSCTDGWTDSLASRQRRSHSRRFPAFAVRCRGQCGAGSERCGEPGVSAHCPQW